VTTTTRENPPRQARDRYPPKDKAPRASGGEVFPGFFLLKTKKEKKDCQSLRKEEKTKGEKRVNP